MNHQPMKRHVSGGLIRVLKHARVAWYRGADGITAYYEQPSPAAPGAVFINGIKLTDLFVDRQGLYADFPSPGVQQKLRERGVNLEDGWMCREEAYGMDISDATSKSLYRAVRHHNGQISAQTLSSRVVILVDGIPRWTVPLANAFRAFAELGVSTREGWYPVQQNLLPPR